MSGKGTSSAKMATNEAPAMAHKVWFFKAREPMRCAACTTMAVTAGLMPKNKPAIHGTSPHAIYTQDSAIKMTKEGSTNMAPATTPPQRLCMSQPM